MPPGRGVPCGDGRSPWLPGLHPIAASAAPAKRRDELSLAEQL